jgi:hypothetical protein
MCTMGTSNERATNVVRLEFAFGNWWKCVDLGDYFEFESQKPEASERRYGGNMSRHWRPIARTDGDGRYRIECRV